MSPFENLGRAVVKELGEPPESRAERQRERLLRALTVRRPTAGQRAPWWVAAAAAVLMVVGWGVVRRVPVATTASVPADSAAAAMPDVWLEGANQPKPVVLDRDATVLLSATGRARMQQFGERERQLTIENGRLDVDLDPKTRARWSFLAGAYRVDVLGTVFSVDYEPNSGSVEVAVTRGTVRVSGGALGAQQVILEAGQRFRAAGATVQVERAAAAEPARPAPTQVRAPAAPPASAEATQEADGWQAKYRSGEYAAALAAAEREGFDAVVARSGPADLADLADTARLSGSTGRARQALLALRQRYAGTSGAARAAFLLGRMEGAPRWFETYLGEEPAGPYAPEASGRLMVAYRDTGDLVRARASARQYLARYPQGAYAEFARSLVAGEQTQH
jgi:hypothetical protein